MTRTGEQLINLFEKMDEESQIALKEYAELLLDPIRYHQAKSEIEFRRKEAASGELISEEDFWEI